MLFDLTLRFGPAGTVFLFFATAAVFGLWVYARLKKNAAPGALALVAVNLGMFLVWTLVAPLDHDEAVHLHLAWLSSLGQSPWRDFWQHHSPLFCMLLEPAVRHAPQTPLVFIFARLAQVIVFAVNAALGWQIARRVWGRQAALTVYLLVLSSVAIFARFSFLRPDSVMVFFLLAAVLLCLDIPGKRTAPSFFAGIAVALAASFMLKQYLLVFLPVYAALQGRRPGRWKKLAAYLAGLCVGVVPLACVLAGRDILRQFFFWVIGFNRQIVVFTVGFPLVVAAAGGWGAYLLWKRGRGRSEREMFIVLVGFGLSTASSLTTTSTVNSGYYLCFWFILCAVAACGVDVTAYLARVGSRSARAGLAGVLAAALVVPGAQYLRACYLDNFFRDGRTVAGLMRYCAGDSCLALMPLHPVFARDVTRLYSAWQYFFVDQHGIVRDDIARRDPARRIIERRPAVVQCRYKRRDFILDLYQKKLISADGYKRLSAFLRSHYTRTMIGKQMYYVRNDLL